MRMILKTRNTEVTEGINEYLEKRFSKLDKYFADEDLKATITLIVEKGLHRIEATIPISHYILRAEEKSGDMYTSIDGIVDKLERQIRKYKTKVNRKNKVKTFTDFVPEPAEDKTEKAIKVKTFNVRPMDEEEAIMQMELLEHDFFVFLDADSQQINVVYKRKDNQYGLIKPNLN